MLSPQRRGFLLDGQRQSSKLSLIADRHDKSQVVRSIAAVLQRKDAPRNWRSSFAFFVPFRRHFNDKQLAIVIFGSSAEVCIQQKSGKRRWEAMISARSLQKTEVEIFRGCARPSCPSRVTPLSIVSVIMQFCECRCNVAMTTPPFNGSQHFPSTYRF